MREGFSHRGRGWYGWHRCSRGRARQRVAGVSEAAGAVGGEQVVLVEEVVRPPRQILCIRAKLCVECRRMGLAMPLVRRISPFQLSVVASLSLLQAASARAAAAMINLLIFIILTFSIDSIVRFILTRAGFHWSLCPRPVG